MAAISAKSFFVALSESVGATYVLLSTALDAGVLAVYLKSWKRVPLHIGASPARVYCFFMHLTEDQLLHSVLGIPFHNSPASFFNLYCRGTACPLLPSDTIEFAPEVLLLFSLDNGPDLVECFLIFLLLGNLLLIFKMLSFELPAMFLVEHAFFLARLDSIGDFLYQQ